MPETYTLRLIGVVDGNEQVLDETIVEGELTPDGLWIDRDVTLSAGETADDNVYLSVRCGDVDLLEKFPIRRYGAPVVKVERHAITVST